MVGLYQEHNVDDIEDLTEALNLESAAREKQKKDLPPRAKRIKKCLIGDGKESLDGISADSVIPGTHMIYVKTWGYSHNTSDSEYMAGQLASYGCKITGEVIVLFLGMCVCNGSFNASEWS